MVRPRSKTDRNRTLWSHTQFWLCSFDSAPMGDPAPRQTENTTNIEKVFASATIARPSSNLIVEGRRAPCSGEPACRRQVHLVYPEPRRAIHGCHPEPAAPARP